MSIRSSNPSKARPRLMWNDPTPTSENSTTIDKPYHMIFAVSERTPTGGCSPTRQTLPEL